MRSEKCTEFDIAPLFREIIALSPWDVLQKMEKELQKGKEHAEIRDALEDIRKEKARRERRL